MNVLITATSGPTAVGIIKCLKNIDDINLFGTDIYENSIGKKWIENIFVVSKHTEENKYKEELKKIIKENNIEMVFPTLQEELILVNEIANEMNIKAFTVKTDNIEKLLNKRTIYEMMEEQGLKEFVPNYSCFNNTNKIKDIIYNSFKNERAICIKKTEGHGGKGFFKVYLNKKDYIKDLDKSIFYIDDIIEFFSLKKFNEEMMICEYIEGEEISVDILRNRGKIISAVTRTRERVSTGIVIDGKVKENKKIIKAASEITSGLKIEGFVNMQFLITENKLKLIDLNPRFCGSQVMSLGAGVNFPKAMIDIYMGKNLEKIQPRWNIDVRRYWETVFYDQKGNIV